MAIPLAPYSGNSTFALVACASVFTAGVAYGRMKIKYLWAHDKSRQKAEAKVEAKAEAKVYVVYMGDLPKGDLSISALHASMLQAAIGSDFMKKPSIIRRSSP